MENKTKGELERLFYDMIRQNVRKVYEKQEETYDSNLEPFSMYMERKENEAIKAGKSLIDEISKAVRIVIREFTTHHDSAAIELLTQGFHQVAERISTNPNTWNIDPSKTIAEIFGYNEPLLEKIYQVGLSCFTQGHIDDAHKVFEFLLLLGPGFSASWIALGLLLKVKKHWKECIHALHIASEIDASNPIPHFHTALCYEALGRKPEAQEELRKALDGAKKRPEHRELVQAIQAELHKI